MFDNVSDDFYVTKIEYSDFLLLRIADQKHIWGITVWVPQLNFHILFTAFTEWAIYRIILSRFHVWGFKEWSQQNQNHLGTVRTLLALRLTPRHLTLEGREGLWGENVHSFSDWRLWRKTSVWHQTEEFIKRKMICSSRLGTGEALAQHSAQCFAAVLMESAGRRLDKTTPGHFSYSLKWLLLQLGRDPSNLMSNIPKWPPIGGAGFEMWEYAVAAV